MIASENFVPRAVLECQGSVLTNKYAEGYPGQALLRRLRVRRHRRAAGDRPRQGAVRGRPRERPAALGRAGQRRRLPRAAAAGRHADGPRARPRRPPDARDEDQRVGPAVRHRAVPGRPRDEPDRHGRGRRGRPGAPAEDDPRRLVGLPAPARLRRVPGDRRRGRRLPGGRHGPLRRARRRRAAPESGALRRRRHDDDPQDDRRRPRRHDPLPRGVRQGDQLGRVPRPAGRPARAHHRRQGGGPADRRGPRPSASARSARWPARARWPRSCSARAAG